MRTTVAALFCALVVFTLAHFGAPMLRSQASCGSFYDCQNAPSVGCNKNSHGVNQSVSGTRCTTVCDNGASCTCNAYLCYGSGCYRPGSEAYLDRCYDQVALCCIY